MNNKQTKPLPKVIIFLFLIQSTTITPMQTPWHEQCFSKEKGKKYAENCKNMQDKISKAIFLRYYWATHSTEDKALFLIKAQLVAFAAQLNAAEQEALLAIKQKYEMSDALWQQYMTEIEQINTSYYNGIQQNHPGITHDPTIPADMQELIIKLLLHNNINPQSITIEMVTDQAKIDANPNTLAQVIHSVGEFKQPKKFLFSHTYKPYKIEIFPCLINRSMITKVGYCAHEIQHILQHSGVSTTVLKAYLKHYYDVDPDEFKQTTEYHHLRKIHEAQAEILSAVKNPEIAHALKTIRSKKLYPNYLYEEHFFTLASIDMLWKVHQWLKLIQYLDF